MNDIEQSEKFFNEHAEFLKTGPSQPGMVDWLDEQINIYGYANGAYDKMRELANKGCEHAREWFLVKGLRWE